MRAGTHGEILLGTRKTHGELLAREYTFLYSRLNSSPCVRVNIVHDNSRISKLVNCVNQLIFHRLFR